MHGGKPKAARPCWFKTFASCFPSGPGEGPPRCGQTAEQPGPTLPEPGQVRRGGVLLLPRPGDLRVQAGPR